MKCSDCLIIAYKFLSLLFLSHFLIDERLIRRFEKKKQILDKKNEKSSDEMINEREREIKSANE